MKGRICVVVAAASVSLLAACGESSSPASHSTENAWTSLGTRTTQAQVHDRIVGGTDVPWDGYDPERLYVRSALTRHELMMPDGTRLAATVVLPADADGRAPAEPLPTIVSMTAYNKMVASIVPELGGANGHFVSHGYAHVAVDVRGTGASGGQWDAFGRVEQADYASILDWVASQPFCDGRIGLYGISYVGITSLLAAAEQHPAVKAVFPIFPSADVYRDFTMSGGQMNLGFFPFWLAVVEGLNVLNPNLVTAPATGGAQTLARLSNAISTLSIPLLVNALVGADDVAYDSDFWHSRSPVERADEIRVPTFIVGGISDIFQRGEPLLYEVIKRNTTTKLLIGPWTHLDVLNMGPLNTGLPDGNIPPLDHIALRWFDQHVKGEDVGADRLPAVTQYVLGSGTYAVASDWPHPQAQARRLFLRGDRSLTAAEPARSENGHQLVLQPLTGLCSPSAVQATGGVQGLLLLPCFRDDSLATLLDAKYETEVLTEDIYINGPIQVDLWISSTSPNATIGVRLSDISPTGAAAPLSTGQLTASFRALDHSRARRLNGEMIQPWHPFTKDTALPLDPAKLVLLHVEIAPTAALISAGHRLRVSVGSSEPWRGLAPLPDLLNSLGSVVTVHSDAEHPSSIVMPVVPTSSLQRVATARP